MITEIYKQIWEHSPYVHLSKSYNALVQLTNQLIDQYEEEKRITSDPFSPTRERTLSLPLEELQKELKGKTCLVTGGLGCVGSMLVKELLKFEVKSIIILDKSKPDDVNGFDENVVCIRCDIRNAHRVRDIMNLCRPDIVFHTAAQRDPGFAESHIMETVTTNVLGTLNVVNACEASGTVKQFVFSSTGKASRYYTEEIYAGTKKICEFIMEAYARTSNIKYSMVRFTHILDNSLMNTELRTESLSNDYVAIHSPGKYVTAQNAKEAAYLMLNALIYSKNKQCQFLLVRNLAWPVESLEMALYHIKQSGRNIPVVFMGNPLGYTEKFFRGQMDWSNPDELNLLMNAYECKYRRFNEAGDIIISRPCTTNGTMLPYVLEGIRNADRESEAKTSLIAGVKELVKELLKTVDKDDTVNILQWGLDPICLKSEGAHISDFGETLQLLTESLEGTEYHKEVENLIYQQAS